MIATTVISKSNEIRQPNRYILLAVIALMLTAAAFMLGCDGESDGAQNSQSGMVVLGLTDAEGDFVTYTVKVLSLTLTKANGAVVETLPLETEVDFAQYTEMTEFLTVATIPAGLYTKASMMLAYQSDDFIADIQVEDAAGNSVPVGQILDENGQSITALMVDVHLEGRNALYIRPGVPAHLTLDFDLKASNHVEFNDQGQEPILTVEPVLLADLDPEVPKIHRLRGPLKEVDVANGRFQVIIRPFWHIISGGHESFGTLSVAVNQDTVFDINGEQLQGEAGLVSLSEQTPLTATIVIGDLNIQERRFEARQVYAGSSVPGGTLDVVTGNLIERENDRLTVKGATLIRAAGSVVFNGSMIIRVDENTMVNRQLSTEDFSIDDISIGQRIRVFGNLNDTETELDATQGAVRMLMTTIKGTVVQIEPTLSLRLTGIDGRRIDMFDFTGTGSDPASDADPDNYRIDTGALDVSGLSPGDPVKVRGFVKPFGHAPEDEDFTAWTLINVADVPGVMVVTWLPASNNAIVELSADGFEMNLEGTGLFHHIRRAGVTIEILSIATLPGIVPDGDGNGIYAIAQGGSRRVEFTFADFAAELNERLAASNPVRRVVARGLFDDASATLTVDWVAVKLN